MTSNARRLVLAAAPLALAAASPWRTSLTLQERPRGPATRHVPALGFRWLTRLYDPLIRLALKRERFKELLVRQLAASPGSRVLDIGCGTATLTVLMTVCHSLEPTGIHAHREDISPHRSPLPGQAAKVHPAPSVRSAEAAKCRRRRTGLRGRSHRRDVTSADRARPGHPGRSGCAPDGLDWPPFVARALQWLSTAAPIGRRSRQGGAS
jgi:hypothetical protein